MAPGAVYEPTSLNFINQPNPIEPQSQSIPQKHPLNGTPQLPQAAHGSLPRLHYDACTLDTAERPSKRRKSGSGKTLDLPKLPVRQTKRLRIPPTLSGLHQPPPNAGLLPSISTGQPPRMPQQASERPEGASQDDTVVNLATSAVATETSKEHVAAPEQPSKGKQGRKKWTDEETAALLKGVARFGIGKWTKILHYADYDFRTRSALDLKDRFRVCCPDDYHSKHKRPLPRREAASVATDDEPDSRASRSDRKTTAELQHLGINQPFTKAQRRERHAYSAAEDEALLEGFNKHGTQWAAIRGDDELDLGHRTARDLRDRMRTKYPTDYAKAGLAPRPDVFPKPTRRDKENEDATEDAADSTPRRIAPIVATISKNVAPNKPLVAETQTQSIFSAQDDDVFFGAAFDDDSTDAEQITLDRGILDWPVDSNKSAAFDVSRSMTIDPIATLNLPRPAPAWAHTSVQQPSLSSALPSLAHMTNFDDTDTDYLALPSLVFGALETDGRVGGHFLGFDELLS